MIWLNSFFIGILTAALGAFCSGFIAALAVDWYNITGREGASGYFVAAIGILGLLIGFVVGCICGGIIQPDSIVSFFKTLGLALGIVIALGGIAITLTRCMADIPPTIDGEYLFLIVEVRLPESQVVPPTTEPGEAYVLLGSLPWGSNVVRKNERGPLWVDDAQFVDRHWMVRGAAVVFTRRGKRFLAVTLGSKYSEGFIVPLPANPGRKYLQWSEWLPRSILAGDLTRLAYRFRVQRSSDPMRTESVGPFEIDTVTWGFSSESKDGHSFVASRDTFHVRYHGKPVDVNEPIQMVAVIPGTRPALLVNASKSDAENTFYLLSDVDGQVRVLAVADNYGNNAPTLISSPPPDPSSLPVARYCSPNRRQLNEGIYRVGLNGVVDTRTLTIHAFTPRTDLYGGDSVPVLGLSPDERSFVRYVMAPDETAAQHRSALTVMDFVADRTYLLPIDRARMHFTRLAELNPSWVDHHFVWTRDAQGVDQLVSRMDFQPLPYRGELTRETDGSHVYRLDGVGEEVRTALEQFLTERYNAQRLPGNYTEYEHYFSADGRKITVNCSPDARYVLLSMEPAIDDALATKIAAQFDAELATGKFDSLFQAD